MQNFEIEELIQKQPKKKNTIINFIIDNPYFVRSNEYTSIIRKYSEVIVFKNTGSYKYFNFIIGVVALFVGFNSFKDIYSRYVFFILLSILIIHNWHHKTRKKEEIKVSEKGIDINNTNFFWDQIYDYGFTIVPRKKTSEYYLEIFTIEGRKISFELHNYLNPEEIIETMNFFRNRYNANQEHS